MYEPGARNGVVIVGNLSAVSPTRSTGNAIRRNIVDATAYVPQPVATYFASPAHIVASVADSTTIDRNIYVGDLPRFVILGAGTNVIDSAHPNTIVDTYCGPPSDPTNHPKISFANLASCTQP